MKQTSSFQRWHRRYFRVKEKKLFYAKDDKVRYLVLLSREHFSANFEF